MLFYDRWCTRYALDMHDVEGSLIAAARIAHDFTARAIGACRFVRCWFPRELAESFPRERHGVGERELSRSFAPHTSVRREPSGIGGRGGRFYTCFDPPSMISFHLSSRAWQPAISSFLDSEPTPPVPPHLRSAQNETYPQIDRHVWPCSFSGMR